MLFFKCCLKCNGDLELEADHRFAQLKCLVCGEMTCIPAGTHLYTEICKADAPGVVRMPRRQVINQSAA
jgi:hypothetical protein